MAEITLDEDKLVELISQVDVKTIRKNLEIVHERINDIIRTMATKTTQNYLIALILAILGLIGTIFVKVLFFM